MSRVLTALFAACALLAFAASPASAAQQLQGSKQTKVLRTLAKFSGPKSLQLRPSGRSAYVRYLGVRVKLSEVGVFRSSIDGDFTRVDLVGNGSGHRFHYAALLERAGGRNKLRYWGQRNDMTSALCKRRSPNSLVVHDLGIAPVQDNSYGVRRCRYDRLLTSYQTPMGAEEIASIRAMYEPQLYFIEFPDGSSESGNRSPVQPDFKEPSATCDWNGGPLSTQPIGQVSREDPRFGVLDISCEHGSINGSAALHRTQLLVSRSGANGAFTRLLAHVNPTWSQYSLACKQSRSWPVPVRVRVGLDFCVPFPGTALSDFNR